VLVERRDFEDAFADAAAPISALLTSRECRSPTRLPMPSATRRSPTTSASASTRRASTCAGAFTSSRSTNAQPWRRSASRVASTIGQTETDAAALPAVAKPGSKRTLGPACGRTEGDAQCNRAA